MAEELNIHWVDDDALLDRFLRDEIDTGERARLQAHLEECSECRGRLRQERAIVEGIRSFARKELKSDLKGQLASRIARRNTAYRWLGAAATIVLAVAVWYVPGEETPVPVLNETPTKEKSAADEGAPKEERVEDAVLETEADKSVSGIEAPAPALQSKPLSGVLDAAAGAAMREDTDEVLDEEPGRRAASGSGRSRQVSWSMAVEMIVQPSAEAPRQEIAAEQMKAQVAEKKDVLRRDVEFQQRGTVVVTQRPFSAADLQVQQIASARRASIPVRFDDSGDSLILTLFPATPWSDAQLRSAQVIEIGTDSLQILIGARDLRVSRSAVLQTHE